ncbi:unnamed protein product [Ostreobium quekettii]|uniref:FHA domain-containing protein n=1 Tax=Ostreobium quekettii TaxID=121088 RepID=A0A8S1JBE2_9CHLO|nr:unnamed protein product [Ostreobium quekettii]|eukprot:evm.model.scf_1049EXC.2 EVM.evm.TU.scf_1049EXC.2   scf_1049EXC:12476-18009(-)
MDRWGDADDPLEERPGKGRVARLGIGGFVKSAQGSIGTPGAHVQGGVEMVPSRIERKKQAAVMVPAQRQASAAPRAVNFRAPSWATEPSSTAALEVMKEGAKIDEIKLNKKAVLFGRNIAVDVVLEHQSISRQHAAICFRGADQQWVLLDLGSVHGTFSNGRRVQQNEPEVLQHKAQLKFGASSRTYIVKKVNSGKGVKHQLMGSENTDEGQAKRVRFADEASMQAASSGPLEKIIGYSDGSHFSTQVGPRDVSGEEVGRFQELVTSIAITREKSKETSPQEPIGKEKRPVTNQVVPDSLLHPRQRGGLYDSIPPPSQESDPSAAWEAGHDPEKTSSQGESGK